jgi:hypothetical protein
MATIKLPDVTVELRSRRVVITHGPITGCKDSPLAHVIARSRFWDDTVDRHYDILWDVRFDSQVLDVLMDLVPKEVRSHLLLAYVNVYSGEVWLLWDREYNPQEPFRLSGYQDHNWTVRMAGSASDWEDEHGIAQVMDDYNENY